MELSFEIIQNFLVQLQNGQVVELGMWAYVLLLLGIMVEGTLTTMLGAAAAAAGILQWELVFALALAGNMMADSFWYMVGRFCRVSWLRRIAGSHSDKVDILTETMKQHEIKVLIMAKLTAGLAVAAMISAGIVRTSWVRLLPVSILGEIIWSGGLVAVGYFAGRLIWQINDGVQVVAIAAPFLAMAAAFVVVQRKLKQKQQLAGATS